MIHQYGISMYIAVHSRLGCQLGTGWSVIFCMSVFGEIAESFTHTHTIFMCQCFIILVGGKCFGTSSCPGPFRPVLQRGGSLRLLFHPFFETQ